MRIRRTKGIAAYTTIIYALLVFISMLIEDAYYSQFNISIVSYMSVSEILLLCTRYIPIYIKPILYIVFCIVFCNALIYTLDYRNLYYTHLHYKWALIFSSRKTWIAKFHIAALYNLAFVFILPIIFFLNPYCVHYLFSQNYHVSILTLFFLLTIELVLLALYIRVLPSFHYKLRIGNTYDSAREYISLYRRYDNCIAPPLFTQRERNLIRFNYQYRFLLLCLLFAAGWFLGQYYVNNQRAIEVKKNGMGTCVVMKGDSIQIDTQKGSINYIGECANYIFLYDKNTQGTLIYNRKDIHYYLLTYDYIAQVHRKYEQQIEHCHDNKTHVLPYIVQQIDSVPPYRNNFLIELPSTYQLIKQSNNHLIWEDAITKTYVEQVNLPKTMFKEMPYDKDIFNVSIYVRESDEANVKNISLCKTIRSTFRGKGGEYVKTFVGDGENYVAWIFYDSSGQNALQGDEIFNTISLRGNVWTQMNGIYHANEKGWNIFFIILCMYYLILLIIISLNDYDVKSSFWNNIKENKWGVFVSFLFFLIIFLSIILGSSHRWLVIFTAFTLYILISLGVICLGTAVCYIKEFIKISIEQKHKK